MPLFGMHIVAPARQYPDCPCCGRDLGGLVESAAFCPGCGSRLRLVATRADRFLTGASRALYFISFGRLGNNGRTPVTVDPGICCTPILVGYASALFNLGWRYERGGGATRNLPEAIRCYRKSARLGNLDAMVRLGPPDGGGPLRVLPLDK